MNGNAFGLARGQLLDIVEVSAGAVELVGESTSAAGPGLLISLDTSGLTPCPSGITVRARERFTITIPDTYPFDPPSVCSAHRRWAGTPHVLFGRVLCLYLAPGVEWNPADGMRGFLARLSEWVERAVSGTLDPDDQPLHPPAVYGSAASGQVVVHPDLGALAPWADDGTGGAAVTLFAWASVGPLRLDVIEWMDQKSVVARVSSEDCAVFDAGGHPFVVLPALLIPGQFGAEYPLAADMLSEGLAEHGYSREQLLWDLSTANLINRRLRRRQLDTDPAASVPWDARRETAGAPDSGDSEAAAGGAQPDEGEPLLTAILVGTPSRRVGKSTRLAHLAAWRLDTLSARIADTYGFARLNDSINTQNELERIAKDWFKQADVAWMRLIEARSEVTNRRDGDTPAHWLAGKRVLVMGCGAVGGPVAEYCARAGVGELTVADDGVVTPGILVRQLFEDADIGSSKASALAARLGRIRRDLDVVARVGDVRLTFLTVARDDHVQHDEGQEGNDGGGRAGDCKQIDPLDNFDLVIDATATASVRSAAECAMKNRRTRPHLVTMVIGHDATRGLVTTNLATSTGGAADTFRKVALLRAAGPAGWDDILNDFFPDPPRTGMFFPEPGCSAPTFIGSGAQTAALAGLMLDEAMRVLSQHAAPPSSSADSLRAASFASGVRLGSAATHRGVSRTQWAPDIVQPDPTSGFEIRIAASALAEIRSEVRRGDRTRGPDIETGGMLLGAFDDATGVIHIDRATGPPPDSYLSATYFQHGIEGTQERLAWEAEHSQGLRGFVGIWHTHPGGHAHPSPTDEQGMVLIVGTDGPRRRALMLILGAPENQWSVWRADGSAARPDIYVRVGIRERTHAKPDHAGRGRGLDLQTLPSGGFFRGGFSYSTRRVPTLLASATGSESSTPTQRRARGQWWRRMRRRP